MKYLLLTLLNLFFFSVNANEWKEVEKEFEGKKLIIEYFKGKQLKVRSTFSKGYPSYNTIIREDWYDDKGNIFHHDTIKEKEYFMWSDNRIDEIQLICNSNLLGKINIVGSKPGKEGIRKEVIINKSIAKAINAGGSGICAYNVYQLIKDDITIYYQPHDFHQGCISISSYSPMFHYGIIYLSKKEYNNPNDFDYDYIEKSYCHLKK